MVMTCNAPARDFHSTRVATLPPPPPPLRALTPVDVLSDPAQAACKKVVTELREEYDLKEKNLRKEFKLKEQKVSLALGATRY